MKRSKTKRFVAIIMAMLMLSGMSVYAAEKHFWQGIFVNYNGYDLGTAYKTTSSNATVRINYSNWTNLATNFIVCQNGTGVQLAGNVFVPHYDPSVHYMPYYAAYTNLHLTVKLRANSAQNQANYTIGGYWSPVQ